jgi:hypothetical protein
VQNASGHGCHRNTSAAPALETTYTMCFGYNSCMVALTKKSANLPQGPLRVRAQDHRYRLGAQRCSKSISRGNLREASYDECFRLGSCSKDPILIRLRTHEFSDYAYVDGRVLDSVDPKGNSRTPTVVPIPLPQIDPKISAFYKNLGCTCGTKTVPRGKLPGVGVVSCQNGQMFPFVVPWVDPLGCGVEDCIRIHETVHIAYFRSLCPNVCSGQTCDKNNLTIVTIGGAPICSRLHECYAYAASISCLVSKFNRAADRGDTICGTILMQYLQAELGHYTSTYDCFNLPGIIKPTLDEQVEELLEELQF